MNDDMMERLQAQTDEEQTGDRERAHAKLEEWDEPLIPKMMGKDYEKYFYMNDEGQDVREIAARNEARAEALWDRKLEQWAEKHHMDKDL